MRRRRDLFAAFLIACGLLAFLPSLRGFFLADDFVLLGWTHGVAFGEIGSFFDPSDFWFYRPLVKVYYWAGQSLFGLQPLPFHTVSVLLHGANAYLLYRLVVRHGVAWVVALGAGLVFLLNPHHAETVSWIAATGDIVAAFCILLSLLLFQRFRESGHLTAAVSSMALFATGIFTRETVIMLPALAVFSLLLPGPRLWRRVLLVLLGYVVILAAYLLVQLLGQEAGSGTLARGGLQFSALGPESILLGVTEYVFRLVPGGELLAEMPLDALRVLAWAELAVLLALALWLWRLRERLALFGLGWMLLTPLLFVFFSPPTGRYFYLPSIGFAILASVLLVRLPLGWASRQSSSVQKAVRGAASAAVALLVLWQAQGLIGGEFAWKVAGDASRSVFLGMRDVVAEPENYSAFFLVDAPPTYNGVPTFVNTLPQAVQLLYDNDTIAASMVTCEWLRDQPELPRYTYIFRFTGRGIEEVPDAAGCK